MARPGPNEPRGKARDIAARNAGISGTTYERAKMVMGKAREEIIEKARVGKISVYKASKLTNIEEKHQKLISEAAKNSSFNFSNSSNIKLYLGDFREQGSKIPDNSIDLVLTDPPYEEKDLPLYADLAYFAARVLKPGGSVIAFAAQYALPRIFDYFEKASELKWIWKLEVIHSGSAAPIYAHHIRVRSKPFLWYAKGAETNTTHYFEDIIYLKPPHKEFHEWAQSPVEADYVIKHVTVENQIVLDPFMGSSEWGTAVLKLNRKFIGIEINPETLQLAKANLAKGAEFHPT
jgi:DNA modification methylase